MGGQLEVCLEAFTKARLTIEDQEDDNVDTTSADDPNSNSDGDYTSGNGMDMMNIDTQAQSFHDSMNIVPLVFDQQTQVSLSPDPPSQFSNNNTMIRKESPKMKKHPGRHGDIRMRRESKLDKRIRIYLYFQPYWQADSYSLRYTHRG